MIILKISSTDRRLGLSQTEAGRASSIARAAERSIFPFPLLGIDETIRIRWGSIQGGSTA